MPRSYNFESEFFIMEENKQIYQRIINQMKQLEIIQTEYITKNQMEILLHLFIQYYSMVCCDNSEMKLSVSGEKWSF